jgi:hypothetical protein
MLGMTENTRLTPAELSLAKNVCGPAGADGTVNSQGNWPVMFVVPEQSLVVVFHHSPYAVSPTNPTPVTLTVAPTLPLSGAMVTDGVIEKLALAWLGGCVAVRVPTPPGPVGRVNVQVKAPSEVVVIVVALELPTEHATGVRGTLSKATTAPELTANPEPATVNELPTMPSPGVGLIVGTVTTNVASAAVPPESVAATVVPEVPAGTSNVQENAPELLASWEPVVQLRTVTPSNTRDARTTDTENPVPEAVTLAPRGP